MDLKTFGENDFDPKKWINKAWSTSGNQDKETFVANTVTRLQLYMKQLTNSLDETTTQIVTSIPRILQDASALQVEGAMLQQRMLSLEMKVQGVEEQTGHSIESLQRIDQLKSRLETAASTLREADKWAALATALEDILESGVPTQTEKLNELAGQVAAMTASLEVLNDAPDYEKKRLQLETLYNRLEAAVSPPLIEALTVMDAAKTATYASVFAGMSRGPSAARCWRRAAGARLAAAWAATDRPGAAALTSLLQGDAARQVEWLTNVLDSKTPLTELITLYTDLLLSLEPSPTKVVAANLKLCSTPDEVIAQLTDLRTDIDAFVAGIRAVMDAPRQNAETVPPQVVLEFGRAAYAPLRSHLPRFSEALSQKLLAQLDSGPPVDQEDLLEYSRALLSTAERCHGWLQAARASALGAAGAAAWPYLAPAVESVCAAMSSRIGSCSRRASEAVAAAAGGVLAHSFPAALAAEAAAAVMLDTLAAWAEDGEDDPAPDHPLLDLPLLLLDKESRAMLSSSKSEPPPSAAALRRAKDHLRSLARVILRQPVDAQLDKIPQLPVWSNNNALSTDLPDFALSPQEYITEIGQYLMTLPQHLEMHLSEKQAPWQFLSEVCTHTCEVYAEKILNIRNMDALGTKRCLTDIVYLSSVVEDLGTNITPALRNLEKTLRAATIGPSEKSNMDQ